MDLDQESVSSQHFSSQATRVKTSLANRKRTKNILSNNAKPRTTTDSSQSSSNNIDIVSSHSENENDCLAPSEKKKEKKEEIPLTRTYFTSSPNLMQGSKPNCNDDSFDLLFLPKKFGKYLDSSKGSDSNDSKNETERSTYFNKGSVLLETNEDKADSVHKQCPVCMGSFTNLQLHLNSCVKKNNVSSEQLSVAWELQGKHVQERSALGLPFLRQTKIKRSSSKAFDRDLSKAISLSLEDSREEGEWFTNKSHNDCEKEKFKPKQKEIKWNGKTSKLSGKPLLLRRTKEERQNIITEKVAIILMEPCSSQQKEEDFSGSFAVQSKALKNSLCKEAHLWKKSSMSPDEIKNKDLYIADLYSFLKLNEDENDETTSEVPQAEDLELAPGSRNDSSAIIDEIDCSRDGNVSKIKQEEKEIVSQASSSSENEENNACNMSALSIKNVAAFTKESKETYKLLDGLSDSWESLVGNRSHSDITVLLSEGSTMCAHSLVFFARCQTILSDVDTELNCGEKILNWPTVSFEACSALFRFIYSGKTNHLLQLSAKDISCLKILAKSYYITDLKSILSNISQVEDAAVPLANREDDALSNATTIGVISDSSENKNSIKENSTQMFFLGNALKKEDINQEESDHSFQELRSSSSVTSTYAVNKRRHSNDSSSTCQNVYLKKNRFESVSERDIEHIINSSDSSIIIENDNTIFCPHSKEEEREWDKKPSSPNVIFVSDSSDIDTHKITVLEVNKINRTSEMGCTVDSCADVQSKDNDDVDEDYITQLDYLSSGFDGMLDYNTFQTTEEMVQSAKKHDIIEGSPLRGSSTFFKSGSQKIIETSMSTKPATEINANLNMSNESCKKGNTCRHSLEKYFENDSFPIEDVILNELTNVEKENLQSTEQGCSGINSTIRFDSESKTTPARKKSVIYHTPSPQVLVSDEVTPLPNYSVMISPDLQDQLRKYGIKPGLGRKKAKLLLRYIYDQIHPAVPNVNPSQAEDEQIPPCQSPTEIQDDSDAGSTHSCISICSSKYSDCKVQEDSGLGVQQQLDSSPEITKRDDVAKAVKDFIRSNDELFESILQYTPIWLQKFHKTLGENGIRCKLKELMDILDDACITFRTETNSRRGKQMKGKKPALQKGKYKAT